MSGCVIYIVVSKKHSNTAKYGRSRVIVFTITVPNTPVKLIPVKPGKTKLIRSIW
jgi:hypothetical protein